MDIKTLLTELRESGMSDREISEVIGLTPNSVWKLRNGMTPTTNHIAWDKLKALSAQITKLRK
jgi:transcriptional regulator with XRE-family HTH domain